jgi:2-polyprenyl-6-methoxyphenol hydroxylase-like FAD-dependent oxidoreductase
MNERRWIKEPSREIPVAGSYDVIVVGGGMAGVAAAIAAARNGARVGLIEKQCALGGLATLGNVTMWLPLCDGRGNQVTAGLAEELLKLSVADLQRDNPAAGFKGIPACWQPGGDPQERTKKRYRTDFNPAAYLFALEDLVVRAGVPLLYDTRFCTVLREDGRITHVVVENKNGRSAMACGMVIDATGDADVCRAAGEETVSLDSNVPAAWFYTFNEGKLQRHLFSNKYSDKGTRAGGEGPFFAGDDVEQVTGHILQSRKQVREKLEEYRSQEGGRDLQLLMPPTIACLRMTRRLVGRFTVGERHVHRWFEDTIGTVGDWRRCGPVYAIPLEALCAERNHNLFAVGRCFSVDNTAWDALRVFAPCVVTGEAAGTAAALAVAQRDCKTGALDRYKLQAKLLAQGVLLDPKLVSAAGKVYS